MLADAVVAEQGQRRRKEDHTGDHHADNGFKEDLEEFFRAGRKVL